MPNIPSEFAFGSQELLSLSDINSNSFYKVSNIFIECVELKILKMTEVGLENKLTSGLSLLVSI